MKGGGTNEWNFYDSMERYHMDSRCCHPKQRAFYIFRNKLLIWQSSKKEIAPPPRTALVDARAVFMLG